MLYIVSTPIGNLADLSFRAVDTLKSVHLILAEDTRHFAKLAQHFGISTPVKSYFDEKERELAPRYVEELSQGREIALVSDAGTPLISDPGYHLVKLARQAGVRIVPVPGPSALLSALAVCGFEIERFRFEGFLPVKSGRLQSVIETALADEAATVFYESPHRLLKSLEVFNNLAPERELFIGRELTKLHEECISRSAKELFSEFSARPSIKGEIVIVVRGKR